METLKQYYANFETHYNEKNFQEAFNNLNGIISGLEKVSVKERLENEDLFKNTYYYASEIMCRSVGLHTKRSEFNHSEQIFLVKAVEHLERALNIDPYDKRILELYKTIILHLSFFERNSSERLKLLTRSLLAIPYEYIVHYNIGYTYHKMNNLENAVFHYKLSYSIICKELERFELLNENDENVNETANAKLNLKQFQIKVLNGLGSLYFTVQNKTLSKKYFLMAYNLDENDPDICNQLAVTYTDERITEKAIYFYEKGIKNAHRAHISTDMDLLKASMYMNMGLMYSYECDIDKSIECYNKSLQYKPKFSLAYQNKLLDLNYVSHLISDPMYLYKSHKLINKVYDQIVMDYPNYKPKDLSSNKLNIGFVSGDFVCHPVSYFLASILDHIDYNKFNVFCYSSKVVKITTRFPNVRYNCIRNLSAEDVKKVVMNDKIDILFDLSGHTGDNRIDVFALKPAPITISYIGYPNTTGLKNMDYRITDKFCDSKNSEKYFTEKLFYLKDAFLCYTPGFVVRPMSTESQSTLLPELSEQPMVKNGYITFGCFNRFNKINADVINVWKTILHKIPNAKLLIKTKEFKSEKLSKKFLDMFNDESLIERIEILPYSDGYTQHLPDYNKIDIALDTFPYSGTTTSCESLMMGVPVLTLFDSNKHYHSQNVTHSLLVNSGIVDFTAMSETEYVNMAVDFASRGSDFFTGLKHHIRDKFCNGKVFQKEEFTKNFENSLTELYTNHFQ